MRKIKKLAAIITAMVLVWTLVCSSLQIEAQAANTFYSYDDAVNYVREMLVAREGTINLQLAAGIDVSARDIMNDARAHYAGCPGNMGDALKVSIKSYSGSCSYSSAGTTVNYEVEYYTTYEQEAELTKAVNEALNSLELEEKSTYEKVKAIHDFICDRVDYDYEHYSDGSYDLQYTAYAAMCNGTSVCEGYAALFYRMCMDAGIPTRIITGLSAMGPHAWNIVKIGNYYYNIDVTWDGQDETISYEYFLKGDIEFLLDRIKDKEYSSEAFCSNFPTDSNSYVDYNSLREPLNADNLQWSFSSMDGSTVSSTASGKPKVLVYIGCRYFSCIQKVVSIREGSFDDVDIICIGIIDANYEEMKSFMNRYGSDDMVFVSSSYHYSMFDYASIIDKTSGTLPVIVYIDADNKVQCITMGEEGDIRKYVDYYCYGKKNEDVGNDSTVEDNTEDSNAGNNKPEDNTPGDNGAGGNGTVDDSTGGNGTVDNGTGNDSTENGSTGDDNKPVDNGIVEAEYVAGGLDYSAVFNANYYYNNNKDVANAFGKDAKALFNHFVNYGINEGRQASEEFSVDSYKAYNSDLVSAFGEDTRAYYLHYIKYGKAEGRTATGSIPNGSQGNTSGNNSGNNSENTQGGNQNGNQGGNQDNTSENTQGGTTDKSYIVDGLDYSAVFNADYYYKHNSDVAAVFGNDESALFGHFINYGIDEGRQACDAFSVDAYKAYNTDVAGAFGEDTRAYYVHYIKYGKAEGRKSTGSTQNGNQGNNQGNGNAVEGLDYSAVFNADYYYNHNKDVANAFGHDAQALLNHFVTYGMDEGRQASEEFNINVYRAKNGDLVSAYGDDRKAYYIHYIKYGKSEGRTSH